MQNEGRGVCPEPRVMVGDIVWDNANRVEGLVWRMEWYPFAKRWEYHYWRFPSWRERRFLAGGMMDNEFELRSRTYAAVGMEERDA